MVIIRARDLLRKSVDLDGSTRDHIEQEFLIIGGGDLCFNWTLYGDV